MRDTRSNIICTEIGNLVFRLIDENRKESVEAHSIRTFPFVPSIPKGMSIRACTVALLTLTAKREEKCVIFSCMWEPEFTTHGGAASGERLDAQEWIADGKIVVIGTEDYVALSERLPECGFSEANYPVRYLPNGFEIIIPRIPALAELSLHFVVAENPYPEPIENSAWYAVDINHGLLENKGRNRVTPNFT